MRHDRIVLLRWVWRCELGIRNRPVLKPDVQIYRTFSARVNAFQALAALPQIVS